MTTATTSPHLWLRGETKKNEHRTALTPTACKTLIENGFKITVERCPERIFNDQEYADVGCTLVQKGTWRTAPSSALITGLKELPENDFTPLPHTHIMFAHCYKQQEGWRDVLGRWKTGKGLLLDLEFLQDESGRRVAAFGYYAGFAGAAVGIDLWCHKHIPSTSAKAYPPITHFDNETDLINSISQKLKEAVKIVGRYPRVMVMGALGRCGKGACGFAERVGIPNDHIIRWDMAETAAGGPFDEIVRNDIFVNCIYLSKPIPPFLVPEQLTKEGRALEVLVDVSCDTTNPHNPIPVYTKTTTFDDPVLSVPVSGGAPLDVVAIDHLPTMLPREASEFFCRDLLPSLLALKAWQADKAGKDARVWNDAEKLFHAKVGEL
ncbi:Saccharopine dehydrogenase [Quaeritorhiza haematococci]|nr:Saccharopine dehydrogenase [Quaeritorhiza haematococci]